MLTLRRVGAKAGIEKRFQVLRIAPTSEANEISKIYGKVTRNSAEVRANLSGVSVKPGAEMKITQGAASIPATVTTANIKVNRPET